MRQKLKKKIDVPFLSQETSILSSVLELWFLHKKNNSKDSECNVSIRNVLLNITRIFMKSKCNYYVAYPSLILFLIEQESIFTFHSLRLVKWFSVAIGTLFSFYSGFPHILNIILFHYRNLRILRQIILSVLDG